MAKLGEQIAPADRKRNEGDCRVHHEERSRPELVPEPAAGKQRELDLARGHDTEPDAAVDPTGQAKPRDYRQS